MKAVTGKDLCRVLEQNGWSLLRINGSHHIYGKAGINARLSVPVHGKEALNNRLVAPLDEADRFDRS